MQFYRLANFYLLVYGLFKFWHYCLNVRLGTPNFRSDWAFCLSDATFAKSMAGNGNCFNRTFGDLSRRCRSAYTANWNRDRFGWGISLLCIHVLGEENQCAN